MYTHDYSFRYNPAMPEVELGIGLLRGQIALTRPAIIDSGSDATMIPVRYLQQLGALPMSRQWLTGIQGGRYLVELYSIYVEIGSYGLYTRAVGDKLNQEVIVGRDILNQFVVTLNGLASVVELSQ